jgi:hypothetical protein
VTAIAAAVYTLTVLAAPPHRRRPAACCAAASAAAAAVLAHATAHPPEGIHPLLTAVFAAVAAGETLYLTLVATTGEPHL